MQQQQQTCRHADMQHVLTPPPLLPPLYRDKLLLRISAATLEALPVGLPYTFHLNATDFTGTTTTAAYTFVRQADGAAPRPALPAGSQQPFRPALGIKVPADVDPATICTGKTVNYRWTLEPALPGLTLPVLTRDLIIKPALTLAASNGSASYVATLATSYSDSNATATVSVTLTQTLAPLVAKLSGTSGDVYTGDRITLSAQGSLDPDSATPSEGLTYSWSCTREEQQPCWEGVGPLHGLTAATPPAIAASQLATGLLHTFKVTVTKGSRSSSAAADVRPVAQPVAQGSLMRRWALAAGSWGAMCQHWLWCWGLLVIAVSADTHADTLSSSLRLMMLSPVPRPCCVQVHLGRQLPGPPQHAAGPSTGAARRAHSPPALLHR